MKKILLLAFSFYFLAAPAWAQTPDTLSAPLPAKMPRVGLVLGGGGAKGAAHIGVLKYMEEIGIPVSYVAGTSMGSIIGGLYAMGYDPDELADLIAHMDWSFYMSNTIDRENLSIERRERKGTDLLGIPFSLGDIRSQRSDIIGSLPSGAVNSSNLLNLFNRLCIGYQDSMDFRDMPLPFACVATDLLTGDSVILNRGKFGKAIRSSMSIPGVFAPVEWDNHFLADGGMVNNFPADVCMNMGADIIIGVEVASKPITDIDSLHSLPQQVMQYLSIATQGNNIENRKLCRIYITPDVTGYNMLSFSTKNIDSLVQRGYREAKLHAAEFLALKAELEKYGPCHKVLQGPRALKLMPGDRIHLNDVNYHGVTPQETRRLINLHYLTPGEEIDIADLEKAVSRLRGSGYYLYAHYILHSVDSTGKVVPPSPDNNRYNVDFQLIPAKPHTLGLGFRFDSEESAAVLFHLGWNEQRMAGLKLFFDLDLAYNFGLNTTLSWSRSGSGEINVDYRYHKAVFRIINEGMQSLWTNRMRIFYSNHSFNHLSLMGGIQQDSYIDADLRNWISAYGYNKEDFYDADEWDLGIFANVKYDNLDDKYFAQRGTELEGNVHLFKKNKYLLDKEYIPYADFLFRWKMYIPLSEHFTLIPHVAGRSILDKNSDGLATWHRSLVGGAFDGRYLDHQIAFIGCNNVYEVGNHLALVRFDLRYQLTPKNYISLMSNAYSEWFDDAHWIDGEDGGDGHWENYIGSRQNLGIGVRFAHNSIFGPLWLDVAWNSRTNKLSALINIGLFF